MSEYTIVNGELYHYGVKGMKWGHRKANPYYQQMKQAKIKKKEANKSFDKAYRNANSLILNSQFDKKDNQRRNAAMMNAAKKAAAADKAYKTAKKDYKNAKSDERAKANADKALAKIEKETYKNAINKYKKEINDGASTVGRLYNKLTGADKIQAEIRYDMEKRAKVNKKWRD